MRLPKADFTLKLGVLVLLASAALAAQSRPQPGVRLPLDVTSNVT